MLHRAGRRAVSMLRYLQVGSSASTTRLAGLARIAAPTSGGPNGARMRVSTQSLRRPLLASSSAWLCSAKPRRCSTSSGSWVNRLAVQTAENLTTSEQVVPGQRKAPFHSNKSISSLCILNTWESPNSIPAHRCCLGRKQRCSNSFHCRFIAWCAHKLWNNTWPCSYTVWHCCTVLHATSSPVRGGTPWFYLHRPMVEHFAANFL